MPAARGPSAAQSGAKRKRPSGLAEPGQEVALGEIRLRVDPALRLQPVETAPAGAREGGVGEVPGVRRKPAWSAPSRAASPDRSAWFERHSPGGSRIAGPAWMWLWPPAP